MKKKPPSVFKNFFIILNFAKKKRLSQIILIFILTLVSICFELLSVGSLIPFMDVLTESSSNSPYKDIFIFLQDFKFFTPSNEKIIFMILFIILVLISYLIKIILIWFAAHITHSIGHEINLKIFNKTVNKEYSYHLNTNSSRFLGNLEKSDIFKASIASILQLGISIVMIVGIFIFILFLDAKLVLTVSLLGIGVYSLIYVFLKKQMSENSLIEATQIEKRLQIMQETTVNIRDILISSLQNSFLNIFKSSDQKLKKVSIKNIVYLNIPGNLVLLLSTIFLSIFIYYYSLKPDGLVSNLSILAAMLFALQKLLPQAQFLYSSLSKLRMHGLAVQDVKILLTSEDQNIETIDTNINEDINFKNNIKIENGTFKYDKNQKKIFDLINFEIKKNDKLLIIGSTGSGKSTLIDILMGLLELQDGRLIVDDKSINSQNMKLWQKKISHIPQQTGFKDSSILENITFSLGGNKIDKERLIESSINAEIYDFIKSKENGFDTIIGEKGVKLSGGQRQRIAIARALYSNKEILFLDEATNALNVEIEEKIFDNILNKVGNKTIIVISHRDKIIDYFNSVYKVENKSVFKIK